MAFFVISYRALVNGVDVAFGTQGATPSYNPNALKSKLETHYRNEFPNSEVAIIVVEVKEVEKDIYWEAQKSFIP